MDVALRVAGLSKVFKVWKRPSDMLVEAVTGRRRHTEFQALDDVSFEMPRGCVMGVLGRNGAGKSTLLRLIAGTLDASAGKVETMGRVAAILELGTGFHPEYSGRDNVFLGGLCLGLSNKEVADRFDEIVAFAELEDVIDQPFRTYSSGMQARLTFAVATSVDADILIIDEALSVGDARFSLKSFDRIQEFRRRGRSFLLVSHDIDTVNSFCDRAILLERGRMIDMGEPRNVGNRYHELLFGTSAGSPSSGSVRKPSPATARKDPAIDARPPLEPPLAAVDEEAALQAQIFSHPESDDDGPALLNGAPHAKEHRYGDGKARITDFHIRAVGDQPTSRLASLGEYEFVMRVEAIQDVRDICMGVLVRTSRGTQLYGADSLQSGSVVVPRLRAGEVVVYVAPFRANLAPGTYFATASLARTDTLKHDLRFDALEFTVVNAPGVYHASLTNLEMSFEVGEVHAAPVDRRLGAA